MGNKYDLLAMCVECHALRGENEKWHPVKEDPVGWFRVVSHYRAPNTNRDITHTLCADCSEEAMKEVENYKSSQLSQ